MSEQRDAFERWWYASKYMQVVISSEAHQQLAWDAWQAALSTTDTAALEAYVAEQVEPWKKRLFTIVMGQCEEGHRNEIIDCIVRSSGSNPPNFDEWISAIDAAIAAQEPKEPLSDGPTFDIRPEDGQLQIVTIGEDQEPKE